MEPTRTLSDGTRIYCHPAAPDDPTLGKITVYAGGGCKVEWNVAPSLAASNKSTGTHPTTTDPQTGEITLSEPMRLALLAAELSKAAPAPYAPEVANCPDDPRSVRPGQTVTMNPNGDLLTIQPPPPIAAGFFAVHGPEILELLQALAGPQRAEIGREIANLDKYSARAADDRFNFIGRLLRAFVKVKYRPPTWREMREGFPPSFEKHGFPFDEGNLRKDLRRMGFGWLLTSE